LRPGTKNGPRHFKWFPTVVQEYFDRKRTREEVSNPTDYSDWEERNRSREEREQYDGYAAVFDPTSPGNGKQKK
jgi:hypothetical protein